MAIVRSTIQPVLPVPASGHRHRRASQHPGTIWQPVCWIFAALLPLQTVPTSGILPSTISILPPSTIFASGLAVIAFAAVAIRQRKSRVSSALLAFVIFSLLHSLVVLFVSGIWGEAVLSERQWLPWLRQVLSLFAGASVYAVARVAFRHIAFHTLAWALVVAFLPSLALSCLAILADVGVMPSAATVVREIRSLIGVGGYLGVGRSSGLALEPAYYATFAVTIPLPFLYYLAASSAGATLLRRVIVILLLLTTLITIFHSSSASGLIVLLTMILSLLLLARIHGEPGISRGILLSLIPLAIVGTALLPTLGVEGTYLSRQIASLRSYLASDSASSTPNTSQADSIYSTLGPILHASSWRGFLGYGLGGSSVYFYEILPSDIADVLASAKWDDLPNLGTLVGRILAEQGVMGLVLFLIVIFRSLRQVASARNTPVDQKAKVILAAAILAATSSLFVKIGSYAMPYIWFLFALSDAYSESHDQVVQHA